MLGSFDLSPEEKDAAHHVHSVTLKLNMSRVTLFATALLHGGQVCGSLVWRLLNTYIGKEMEV